MSTPKQNVGRFRPDLDMPVRKISFVNKQTNRKFYSRARDGSSVAGRMITEQKAMGWRKYKREEKKVKEKRRKREREREDENERERERERVMEKEVKERDGEKEREIRRKRER